MLPANQANDAMVRIARDLKFEVDTRNVWTNGVDAVKLRPAAISLCRLQRLAKQVNYSLIISAAISEVGEMDAVVGRLLIASM